MYTNKFILTKYMSLVDITLEGLIYYHLPRTVSLMASTYCAGTQ